MGRKGHVSIWSWDAGSHGSPEGGAGLALQPGSVPAPPLKRPSAHVYPEVPELYTGTGPQGLGSWNYGGRPERFLDLSWNLGNVPPLLEF